LENWVTRTTERTDKQYMDAALALARRGLGLVWPNPAVGCVLVDEAEHVVGRGWTQPGGRPHAETEALSRAGEAAKGATAYVTLEPCAHFGETPPCAKALIDAGVARVVIAMKDPDPRVAGRGVSMLEDAGIEVNLGLREDVAADINAGFVSRITQKRPLVTLKAASTLDGRIATASGESKWITGEAARNHGHVLRARNDAILVGIDTALADDPHLDCRLPGMEGMSPVRVVADTSLRIDPASRLVKGAQDRPTWVFCAAGAEQRRIEGLTKRGVTVIEANADADGRPAVADILTRLAERGITRVLVEGGGRLAATFLKAGMVDRLAWFRAPGIIGADGIPAIANVGIGSLTDAFGFKRTSATVVGNDVFEEFRRKE
jgi:diaminohydroxyphosphoribosylaminopyrimidine deaminase / 5-amino-6-(5-phosphoribosylamino)uracil reductase